ncbi:hypothetical protein, partial [Streptomyces europaeiscabiei]|uniref:hypothetical protein n=1 Tax=Streptomyces europaeiscabiei TaxID=146819 RepID=UPI0019698391
MDKISTHQRGVIRKSRSAAFGYVVNGRGHSLTSEHISLGRMSSPSTGPYLRSGELALSLPATTQVLCQFRFIWKESGGAATTAALIPSPALSAPAIPVTPRVRTASLSLRSAADRLGSAAHASRAARTARTART